jgi:hypothetical protein
MRSCVKILLTWTKRFVSLLYAIGLAKSNMEGVREGTKSLLSQEQTEESVLQAWNRWKLRDTMESRIGKGKFAMAEYEKVRRFTIPVDNEHLLLVSTEVDADLNMIYNILKLIH